MKLNHINLDNLKTSPLNVRKHGEKRGEDLIPSIKAMGLIQPLLVRPNCEGFEVIAGQRRLSALQEIAKSEAVDPVPCLVMEDKDDAKAIEASLIENIARLPMDVLDQFEAFQALVKEGRSVEEIATHFGVTEKLVTQRLAIANLYPPIRKLYRAEEINMTTLQILTMATTRQQKDWYKLFKSKDGYAPQGWQLKNWLFGGDQILTCNALFDLESYSGSIIPDLFEEERYFADPKLFWEYQSRAIADLMEEYKEDGWSEVILLDVGAHWSSYEHVDTPKEEGGKVYIRVSANGEVTPYEGQLSRDEIKRREREENGLPEEKPVRPELTKAMQNYLALHRHAAVRSSLLEHSGIALRLVAAHMMAGSGLWTVSAEPQKASSEAIEQSLSHNTAQAAFKTETQAIRSLLGINVNDPAIDQGSGLGEVIRDLHDIFAKLLTCSDEEVMRCLTYLMAESLQSGTAMIEQLGIMLKVDMSDSWQMDDCFFDLLRDKEVINAMLAEIGGEDIAKGNLTSTAKVQKQIIQDFISGNGRQQNTDWHPRYASFPMSAYTARGGVEAINQYEKVKGWYKA